MRATVDERPTLADRSLCEIALPGSHNSGSFAVEANSALSPDAKDWVKSISRLVGPAVVGSICAPWSRCQRFDILTQLLNGIRYLDLRVCQMGDDLFLCHGQLSVAVHDAFQQINDFLTQVGPDEIILLDFNHFYAMDDSSHEFLCALLLSLLGQWICSHSNRSCRSTLRELWSSNEQERVIVIYHNQDTAKTHPWLWPSECIQSPWPDTTDKDHLMEYLKRRHAEWRADRPSVFRVAQALRTPDVGMVMQSVMPLNHSKLRSVEDLALGTQGIVCDWLETCGRQRGAWSGELSAGLSVCNCVFLQGVILTELHLLCNVWSVGQTC